MCALWLGPNGQNCKVMQAGGPRSSRTPWLRAVLGLNPTEELIELGEGTATSWPGIY